MNRNAREIKESRAKSMPDNFHVKNRLSFALSWMYRFRKMQRKKKEKENEKREREEEGDGSLEKAERLRAKVILSTSLI